MTQASQELSDRLEAFKKAWNNEVKKLEDSVELLSSEYTEERLELFTELLANINCSEEYQKCAQALTEWLERNSK